MTGDEKPAGGGKIVKIRSLRRVTVGNVARVPVEHPERVRGVAGTRAERELVSSRATMAEKVKAIVDKIIDESKVEGSTYHVDAYEPPVRRAALPPLRSARPNEPVDDDED